MSTFKREKPHIRIDRIGREMTPIERAAKALSSLWDDASEYGSQEDMARAVYETIDTNQLANVISTTTTCDGQPNASELHHRQALAVKNWLTGNN